VQTLINNRIFRRHHQIDRSIDRSQGLPAENEMPINNRHVNDLVVRLNSTPMPILPTGKRHGRRCASIHTDDPDGREISKQHPQTPSIPTFQSIE
jgi:hypothetical protein